MHKSLSTLLIAAALLLCNANRLQAGTINYHQTFSTSELAISKVIKPDAVYHRVSIGRSGKISQEPGMPELPARYVTLALPNGATDINLSVTYALEEAVPGKYLLYPTQPPAPLNGDTAPYFIPPNTVAYREVKPFPNRTAEIQDVWAGDRCLLVRVVLYPLQYWPIDSSLTLIKEISFDLEYQDRPAAQNHPARRNPGGQNVFDLHLLGTAANKPQNMDCLAQKKNKLTSLFSDTATLLPSDKGRAVDYLIITSAELATKFDLLADWKTRKGIFTQVRTLELIDQNYQGIDLQQKIRRFIQQAYLKWGTTFVLLAGDYRMVPVRYVPWNKWPAYIPDLKIPTDLYYSDIIDTVYGRSPDSYDYDANRNGIYGELEWDLVDQHPDVFLGRVPVADTAQAVHYIEKVINYETNPPAGFGSSFLMLADGGFACNTENVNISPLSQQAPWIDPCELYTPVSDSMFSVWSGDRTLDASTALEELNRGYNLIYHFDHGGVYQLGMAVGSGGGWIYRGDAINIVNKDRPSILITPACSPNAFDHSSFANALINDTAGGAVAFIGNSRVGWSSQGYICQNFFINLFEGPSPWLGTVFNLMQDVGDNYSKFSMNLLGDPSLCLWTADPSRFNVLHPKMLSGADSLLEVDVNGFAGRITVCLYRKPGLWETQELEAPVRAVFDIGHWSPGPISITVSGRNMIPYSGECLLDSTRLLQPFVSGWKIIDLPGPTHPECVGNGNLEANPGEVVALYPVINNPGDQSFSDLNLTLVSSDPLFNILDSRVHIGDVKAFSLEYPDTSTDDFFLVKLGDVRQSYSLIGFTVAFVEAGPAVPSNTVEHSPLDWTHHMDLPVLADSLILAGLSWRYLPEEAGIRYRKAVVDSLVITNRGSAPALGLQLTVSGYPERTGSTDTIYIGDIAQGQSVICHTGIKLPVTTLQQVEGGPVVKLEFKDSSSRSTIISASLDNNATKVQSVYAKVRPGIVEINWYIPPEDRLAVSSYNVYRQGPADSSFSFYGTAPVTGLNRFVDENVLPNTAYRYAVRSVDKNGNPGLLTDFPGDVVTMPALRPGFPVQLGIGVYGTRMWSSPAAGDLDGDGYKEVVIGCDDGKIYGFSHDGQPLPGWPVDIGCTIDQSSPAIGDLDGDGKSEVVLGNGGWYTLPGDNMVHILRVDGSELDGWPQSISGDAFGSCALADINQDGSLDVIAATTAGYVYAWDSHGSLLPGWPYYTGGPIWASPSVGQLDDKKELEVVVLCNSGGSLFLFAIKADGTDLSGWPVKVQNNPGYAMSSPVMVDLDDDDKTEILLGAEPEPPSNYTRAFCFRHNGKQQSGWPVFLSMGTRIMAAPGVGDFNGDDKTDVVFMSSSGQVSAFDSRGMDGYLWTTNTGSNGRTNPVCADINVDGFQDIVLTTESGYVKALSGRDGSELDQLGFFIEPSWSAPSLTDLDNDGKQELLAFGWGSHRLNVWNLSIPANNLSWNTFMGNMRRTGWLEDNDALCSSTPAHNAPAISSFLGASYPNPSRDVVWIKYGVKANGTIRIAVYNITGQKVKTLVDKVCTPGEYVISWDGKSEDGSKVCSGSYFYKLESPGHTDTKRMLLIR